MMNISVLIHQPAAIYSHDHLLILTLIQKLQLAIGISIYLKKLISQDGEQSITLVLCRAKNHISKTRINNAPPTKQHTWMPYHNHQILKIDKPIYS